MFICKKNQNVFFPLSMNNNFYYSKKNIDNKKSYTQRNNFALQWYGTLRGRDSRFTQRLLGQNSKTFSTF